MKRLFYFLQAHIIKTCCFLLGGGWCGGGLFSFFFLVAVPSSVPISEALLLCRSSWHPYLKFHQRLILHLSHTWGPQVETSDHWWAAIQRWHCTAAKLLLWFNTCRTPYWQQSSPNRRVWVSEHPLKRANATMSLHQSSNMDSLTLRAFDQNCLRYGRRQEQTEVTTRAWHEELQTLRQSFFMQG